MKDPIELKLIEPIEGYSDIVQLKLPKPGDKCISNKGDGGRVFTAEGGSTESYIVLTSLNKKYDSSDGDLRAHLKSSSVRQVPVTGWVATIRRCPFHRQASIVSVMLEDGDFLRNEHADEIDFSEVVACKFERCAEGWEL